MPALLINVKIDSREKLNLFKVTLSDLSGLFEECHVKVRGTYSRECVEHAQSQLGTEIQIYQELQESDWVAATLLIIRRVKCRSIFLYFEDHRLVGERQDLETVLEDFDRHKLDYLCYSFFQASQLDKNNILPLGPIQAEQYRAFTLTQRNLNLIGKISPSYYTFSLVSLTSVAYFSEMLSIEDKRHKIFSSKVIAVFARLFPYPGYKRAIKVINYVLSWFSTRLCVYPPASPFNLEKIWFESKLTDREWKFGILKRELFANYDDDNGAYAESLIKRGLYPLDAYLFHSSDKENLGLVVRDVALAGGESLDCTYYSHNGRICRAPRVEICVVRGNVTVLYQGKSFPLSSGETKLFYSNLGPVIRSVTSSELKLKVFDEVFSK